jgi:hypothetical protein
MYNAATDLSLHTSTHSQTTDLAMHCSSSSSSSRSMAHLQQQQQQQQQERRQSYPLRRRRSWACSSRHLQQLMLR